MLEIGDVVMLKSGGPAMTVLTVWDKKTTTCVWYAPVAELFKEKLFVTDTIRKIQMKAQD